MTLAIGPILAAAVLALVHILASELRRLREQPRSHWLSVAGGVAVAYVFVHLLPELAEGQQHVNRWLHREPVRGAQPAAAGWLADRHVYVMALVGLVAFYGLEKFALTARHSTAGGARAPRASRSTATPGAGVFWVHIASFAAYNALIGYLLLHREESEQGNIPFFAIAMALHFLVTDVALDEHHEHRYRAKGRWLLAAAVLLGALAGAIADVGAAVLAMSMAFLAGGIILNVLKEEVPNERQGRFWAFAAGMAAYTALSLFA